MTNRKPKSLTPEEGEMLRKRAALLNLLAQVDAGMEPTRHEIALIDAYLLGAKIALETPPPPAPLEIETAPGVTLVVENGSNRAQKRAAARASKRKPVKRGQATKKKAAKKKAAKKTPKLAPNAAP